MKRVRERIIEIKMQFTINRHVQKSGIKRGIKRGTVNMFRSHISLV